MLQPPGSIIELCHVVDDMDKAISYWTALGAGPFFVGDMRFEEGHKYRGDPSVLSIQVGFGFSGGLLVELVKPMEGDESVFSEALKKTGPGYHHVMLRVDFDEGCKKMKAQGFPLALESTTPLGERCALFDTTAVNGGFIEIMDLHIGFGRLTEIMAGAHENWDGRDPKRPLEPLFAELAGAH